MSDCVAGQFGADDHPAVGSWVSNSLSFTSTINRSPLTDNKSGLRAGRSRGTPRDRRRASRRLARAAVVGLVAFLVFVYVGATAAVVYTALSPRSAETGIVATGSVGPALKSPTIFEV